MSKDKIITIDGVRYHSDRPSNCRRCYFWKNRKASCIIFTIVQHTWSSMAILIMMEVFLVLITAGTGVIEGVLQMASESLDRS